MSRRQAAWLTTLVALVVIATLSAPAFPSPEDPAAQAPAPAPEVAPTAGENAVEQILRQQEALITGQQFSYDPQGRRDPFRSLFETVRLEDGRKRPAGAAGMLVAEIDLAGVVRDPAGGDVAVVMGSDNKGYFLRVGDKVYDGTVIAVDTRLGSVTFRQQVDDPRMIKPFRDIVKRLVPLQTEQDVEDGEDEESADE